MIKDESFFKFKISLWGIFHSTVTVGVICSIGSFCGRLWWPFELLSHFRVHYSLFFLICSIILLLYRKKGWLTLLMGIIAIVNMAPVLPFYFDHTPNHPNGNVYKVLIINVSTGNLSYQKLFNFIKEVSPDFLLVEEVNIYWINKLHQLHNDYPYVRYAPREDNFGIALLSRYSFENAVVMNFGKAGVPSIIARYKIEGKALFIIGTHTLPPWGSEYFSFRNDQLTKLSKFIVKVNEPMILLGDLNMTPWSPYFKDFLEMTGLKDSQYGFGIQATWPVPLSFLGIPIDHCLISNDLVVLQRYVGPNIGSDHYPVIIEFSIR